MVNKKAKCQKRQNVGYQFLRQQPNI